MGFIFSIKSFIQQQTCCFVLSVTIILYKTKLQKPQKKYKLKRKKDIDKKKKGKKDTER